MSWRCLFGHDWDGHTDPNYPAPHCRRCDKVYRPTHPLIELLGGIALMVFMLIVMAAAILGIQSLGGGCPTSSVKNVASALLF